MTKELVDLSLIILLIFTDEDNLETPFDGVVAFCPHFSFEQVSRFKRGFFSLLEGVFFRTSKAGGEFDRVGEYLGL